MSQTHNANVALQLSKLKKDAEATDQKVADKLFQHYKSPKVAMRAVTNNGVLIKFVNFELLTQDPEVIEYLDAQIAVRGLPGVTKQKALTLEDRNPEKAMERRLREEIEARVAAEIEAGTFGKDRQFGESEGASGIGATTSQQTAN